MIENAMRMRCGACGGDTFAVYEAHSGDGHGASLVVECLKCKSTTTVKAAGEPRIDLAFGDGSEGMLAVFGG